MEVDDTRVRYTLPFWWRIGLVLTRRNSTGCIAGISAAWIPSHLSWHVLARFFSHSRLGAPALAPQFSLIFSFSPTLTHTHNHTSHSEGIMTYGSPRQWKSLTILASGRRGYLQQKQVSAFVSLIIGWSAAFASLRVWLLLGFLSRIND